MEYKNIFSFGVEWNYRTVGMFVLLLILPNLLGMLNVTTPFGFNIHFFQFAIFVAAVVFGPLGGLMSGLFGSAYSAVLMHNPSIIVGNMILGFLAGMFFRYGWHAVVAALLAFAVQLLWLVPTDLYLMHMPLNVVGMLVVALLISNVIWATLANYAAMPLRKVLRC